VRRPEHPRPDRELDVVVALDAQLDPAREARSSSSSTASSSTGFTGVGPSATTRGPGLELGEEEHLVDQLRDLVDLGARLLDEPGNVLAGKRRSSRGS
jgi:hypothetical protein